MDEDEDEDEDGEIDPALSTFFSMMGHAGAQVYRVSAERGILPDNCSSASLMLNISSTMA